MIRFLVLALGLFGIGSLLSLELIERWAVYPMSPKEVAPAEAGLPSVQARRIAHDGETLITWVAQPQRGRPVIFYLHGNGGNLALRAGRFQRFLDRGYGIIAPAYRGSSGSTGTPGEAAITGDILHIWHSRDTLIQGLAPRRVIVFGESLGTGVSVALLDGLRNASAPRPAGVILEAPFTSAQDVARAAYNLPESLLSQMTNTWDSLGRADALDLPLLVFHGTRDRVIPFAQGQTLFRAAASRDKDFVAVKDASHFNIWRNSTRRRMWRFVDSYAR